MLHVRIIYLVCCTLPPPLLPLPICTFALAQRPLLGRLRLLLHQFEAARRQNARRSIL